MSGALSLAALLSASSTFAFLWVPLVFAKTVIFLSYGNVDDRLRELISVSWAIFLACPCRHGPRIPHGKRLSSGLDFKLDHYRHRRGEAAPQNVYPIQKSVFQPSAVVAKSVSFDQLMFIGIPKKLNVRPMP